MAEKQLNRRPLKTRNTVWAGGAARWLVRAHVRPNQISLASIVVAAAAGACLLRGYYIAAALLIQLRLLCNMLDGMVAIEGGLGSAAGEIYNDLPDRISDALILVAAGYSLQWPVYARELGWTAALLAVMTAYIRVLGGSFGLPQDFRGPMGKPQRMAVMTIGCVIAVIDTRALAAGLAIVIVGSFLTAMLRLRSLVQRLEAQR